MISKGCIFAFDTWARPGSGHVGELENMSVELNLLCRISPADASRNFDSCRACQQVYRVRMQTCTRCRQLVIVHVLRRQSGGIMPTFALSHDAAYYVLFTPECYILSADSFAYLSIKVLSIPDCSHYSELASCASRRPAHFLGENSRKQKATVTDRLSISNLDSKMAPNRMMSSCRSWTVRAF